MYSFRQQLIIIQTWNLAKITYNFHLRYPKHVGEFIPHDQAKSRRAGIHVGSTHSMHTAPFQPTTFGKTAWIFLQRKRSTLLRGFWNKSSDYFKIAILKELLTHVCSQPEHSAKTWPWRDQNLLKCTSRIIMQWWVILTLKPWKSFLWSS